MTQPTPDSLSDHSHEHVDLGALMDGSARGPQEPDGSDEYGAAADASGETVDGYVTGQDEGSID